MSYKKTFIPAPNCEYPPNGSIRLGVILSDPFDPGTCLNPDGPLPFPDNMPIQKPDPKTNWVQSAPSERGGLIGLWARFLEFIGIEAELSFSWESSKGNAYEFKEMQAEFFDPTMQYTEESVLNPPVARYIKENRFHKPVYMITGVRIVKGADVAFSRSKAKDMKLKVGADGKPAGVPAGGGFETGYHAKDNEDLKFSTDGQFVFAYRLREIYYSRALKIQHRPVKGSTYEVGADEQQSFDSTPRADDTIPEVSGVASEEKTFKSLDFSTNAALDDFDSDECVLLATRNLG